MNPCTAFLRTVVVLGLLSLQTCMNRWAEALATPSRLCPWGLGGGRRLARGRPLLKACLPDSQQGLFPPEFPGGGGARRWGCRKRGVGKPGWLLPILTESESHSVQCPPNHLVRSHRTCVRARLGTPGTTGCRASAAWPLTSD